MIDQIPAWFGIAGSAVALLIWIGVEVHFSEPDTHD